MQVPWRNELLNEGSLTHPPQEVAVELQARSGALFRVKLSGKHMVFENGTTKPLSPNRYSNRKAQFSLL